MVAKSPLYDSWGAKYDSATRAIDRFVMADMRDHVLRDVRYAKRVLEIAVGTGKNVMHCAPGAELVGVDLSPRMLDVASAKAARHGVRFEGHVCDAMNLPFERNSFDAVVCTLAACTFSCPVAVLREMRRVLVPGGLACFIEHTNDWRVSPSGRRMLDFVAPVVRTALGCHTDRDTRTNILLAGFDVRWERRAAGNVLLGMLCTKDIMAPRAVG